MAKSRNTAHTNGTHDVEVDDALDSGNVANPKEPSMSSGESSGQSSVRNSKEPRASAVPRDSKEPSKKLPGRPRKRSQQGKGGGPKTKAGKATVSRNAIKHAIWSFDPVVIEGFESKEMWQHFRKGIVESLKPIGALEEELADNIALNRWRLRRVTHAETASINLRFQETREDMTRFSGYLAPDPDNIPEPTEMQVAARQQTRVIPSADEQERFLRPEAHLHRIFIQLVRELEALQNRRMGEPSNLHRMDISSAPAQFGRTSSPKLPEIL